MSQPAVAPSKRGRPTENAQRKYYEGKLYPLLAQAMTQHIDASRRLNVGSLANAIGVSGQTLYFSMGEDRVTPRVAKLLITESRGRLKPVDLAPFLLS